MSYPSILAPTTLLLLLAGCASGASAGDGDGDGDGDCAPACAGPDAGGSDAGDDQDPVCGNGVREGSETCDGSSCPLTCTDADSCTLDSIAGSAVTCTAVCQHTPMTTCAAGDGCC